MLGRNTYLRVVFIAMVLCFGPNPRAMAETPKAQLQETIERVMEVLQTIRSAEDIATNKGVFQRILLERFDFAEMARRSLGSQWDNLNEKKGEFVLAFTQFIERSYLGRLGSYRGEKIVYGREQVNQEFGKVDTQVVGGRGDPIEVDYRLYLVGGEWKVYDVVIDQVSLVSNYRSQFRRVLQKSSLEELLRRLHEKGSDHES